MIDLSDTDLCSYRANLLTLISPSKGTFDMQKSTPAIQLAPRTININPQVPHVRCGFSSQPAPSLLVIIIPTTLSVYS